MPLSRIGKIGSGLAVGTAVLLGASPALAVGTWTTVPVSPTGVNANLFSVTSTSDTDAWAVGSELGRAGTTVGAKALIEHWDGTAWSQAAIPNTPQSTAVLASVSASSPTDAWAVGHAANRSSFTPVGLHWNGTAWSFSPTFANALSGQLAIGVADIAPTDAYAIGGGLGSAHEGLVAHWDGRSWTKVTVPLPANNNNLPSSLNAISADGPNDVWIVGTSFIQINPNLVQRITYSLHFDGSTWSVVPMPVVSSDPNISYQFAAIKANSPTDVWAVGSQGVVDSNSSTLIEHFNGTSWSIVPSPSPGNFAGLSGVTTSNAANSMWAVGSDEIPGTATFRTLTEHWDGTAWSVVPSPNAGVTTTFLSGVATTPGASIVQAVGYSGITGRFNPFAIQNR